MRNTPTGRIGLVAALLVAALTLTGCPDFSFIVIFDDANLEVAVRDALDQPLGVLTPLHLMQLRTLSAPDSSISDISGLEYCVNLTYLDLSGNTISDLTPLSGLANLQILDLENNTVFDVGALAGLRNLTALNLCGNTVYDIAALVTNSVNGGLGPADYVALTFSNLSSESENSDVPLLESRGVNVVDCGSSEADTTST
jgi:Leucine Rich Repeat (LRR) protein